MHKITRRQFCRLLLGGAAALSLPGCGQSGAGAAAGSASFSAVPAALVLSPDTYPKVEGSVACQPLLSAMLEAAAGLSPEDAQSNEPWLYSTAAVWRALAVEYTPDYDESFPSLIVAYEAPADVQQEMDIAAIAVEKTPIAQDALVFFVSEENAVRDLTRAQLQAVYSGKLENWQALGGADEAITACQCVSESPSQTLLLDLVLQGAAPAAPPTELYPLYESEFTDVPAAFDGSRGALAFSTYYYLTKMYAGPSVRLLSVDGCAPTDKTVADGSYPLCCPIYAALRADEPQDSPARTLYTWLQSEAGAACLRSAGYFPVSG